MIARVTASDLDDLLPLMRAYCDFYATAPPDDALRRLSEALLDAPDTAGIQFIDRRAEDGVATGFATLYWTFSTLSAGPIGVMNDLFVSAPARGRGIATALIAACATASAEHGAITLDWMTSPTNERAQRVYDRVGATRTPWLEYSLALSEPGAPSGASSPAAD